MDHPHAATPGDRKRRPPKPKPVSIPPTKGSTTPSLDTTGHVVSWSDGAERIKGYKAEEIIGKHFSQFYPEQEIQGGKPDGELVIASTEGYFEEEGWRVRKDGSRFLANVLITALRDDAHELRGFAKVTHDITGRKRAAAALREKEQKQAAFLESLTAAKNAAENELRETEALRRTLDEHSIVSVADTQGRIVYVNDAFCKISQYTRAELLGQDHRKINSGKHPKSFWAEMWRTNTGGQHWRGDVCNRSKDGALYWVDSVIAPVTGVDGKIHKYISICNDVTSYHKLAEGALTTTNQALQACAEQLEIASKSAEENGRSLERFQLLLDGARDCAIIMLDNHGIVQNWNRGAQKLKGYAREEILGKSFTCFYPATDSQAGKPQRELKIAIETGVYEEDGWRVRKDGSRFWANVIIEPMRDRTGRQIGFSKIIRDLTDTEQAHTLLRASDMKVRAIYESSFQFIGLLDPDGRVLEANETAMSFIDCPLSEVRGKLFWETPWWDYSPVEQARCKEAVLRAAAGETVRMCTRRKNKSGQTVDIDFTLKPMRDGTGHITHVIPEGQDVTELKRAQQAMNAARVAADVANQAKSDFLANMSHEIRTPMAAILGYADLMLDPTQSKSGLQNGLQAIRRNGKHLLEVINDVLDLSKIEAGGMTVERIACELSHVAAEAISITEAKAVEKGLTLSVEFATSVPRTGLTDPLRLRQTLVNLIGNAIKFTEKGSVVIRVSCDGPSDTDARMIFEVIDTGVGMTEVELPRLFKVFSQADASTTRRFGGTGLGLAISRQFAKLLGGDISVKSEAGKGSTFTLHVLVGPVAKADMVNGAIEKRKAARTTDATSISAESLLGVRILLAEDGFDNRIILSAYLRGAGATVEMVEDGGAAVEAVTRSLKEARPYSIVLMDMQMPVLDGYAASSELRRVGHPGPIVALTAHAMLDDRAKCIKSGCSEYMSKPVDRTALLWMVARQTNRTLQTTDIASSQPPKAPGTNAKRAISSPADGPIRSQLALDPEFADVLGDFVSRLPARAAELRRFANTGSGNALAEAAHKLRGAAGTYGLAEISAAAGLVEDQLLAGDAIAEVALKVESLLALVRRVDGYNRSLETATPQVTAIANPKTFST
jgi:PAS domain S-box-containing protein